MDNEWEDITPTQDNEWEDITPQAQAPQKQGFMGSLMESLSRPGASVRARVRELGQSGDIKKANQAASAGWQDPGSVETFQNENLRNINKILPENADTLTRYTAGTIPSAAGLAGDIITDPVQLAAGFLTEGAMRGLAPVKYKGVSLGDRASKLPIQNMMATQEGQASQVAKQSGKAIENVERLLKPSGDFSRDIKSGGTANMVEQSRKYIQPAKNYTEVVDQMELSKGFPVSERQKLYDTNKASPLFHNESMKLRSRISSEPQAGSRTNATKAKQIDDILTADIDDLNNATPEQLTDPNFYQARKEYYQGLADEAGAYGADPSTSTKAEAYRALARDYQNKTYSISEQVAPLNAEYQGLDEASTRASELAQIERGQAPKSIPQEIVESIRPSKPNIIATLVRKITGDRLFNPVHRFSKGAAKAQAKSEKAQSIYDLLGKLSNKPTAQKPGAPQIGYTPSFPKQLGYTPPKPAQIGYDRKSFLSRMLPNMSSGKTIKQGYDPSRQAIELPELTETQMQELAKKWGYRVGDNPREVITEFTPPSSPLTYGDKGISTKMRKTLKQLMERRKKNFPS